ncbi:glycosyltransferase family 2 protein [Eubacterium sp.]|uniref:glycosyltransferase family 2 protein n=1 Tax=Eubacterium sp. TaxID=142586 RepID=UPI0025E38C5B|nr:glycosyltransferase family 2 protein [Eubacterium sp.]MCR5628392.1 glycosyltransferase family 2 protein [Eubacterium sp.]
MKILVIVPAYNESENIEKVVRSLEQCETKVDYLVVNDCSTDNTKDILENIGANYINLPVNLGIGGAVQSGYLYAYENGYDIAIQIDGDGQHDPAYIGKLIKPIIDGEADICIGSRFIDKEGFQSSALRRFGINFLSFLIKLSCGIKVCDVTSGFRATNVEFTKLYAKDYAQDYPEPEAIVTGVMNGARISEVPVIMREREGGESSIKSFKSLYYMIKVSIAIVIKRITVSVGRKK